MRVFSRAGHQASDGFAFGEGRVIGIPFGEARSAGIAFGEGISVGFPFGEPRETGIQQIHPRQTRFQQETPRQTKFQQIAGPMSWRFREKRHASTRPSRIGAPPRNLWVRRRRTTAGRKECGSRLRRVAPPRGKSPAKCGAPPRASATVSSGRAPGAHGCGKGASKVVKSQLARASVRIFMQP